MDYLVRSKLKLERMTELRHRLMESAFSAYARLARPLPESLNNARVQPDGIAVWETKIIAHRHRFRKVLLFSMPISTRSRSNPLRQARAGTD
jgi:hypothetical protein